MFAGPNGAGKTVLKSYLSSKPLGVYLNPDEIQNFIETTGTGAEHLQSRCDDIQVRLEYGAVNTDTLAQKLGTTVHFSPLCEKSDGWDCPHLKIFGRSPFREVVATIGRAMNQRASWSRRTF